MLTLKVEKMDIEKNIENVEEQKDQYVIESEIPGWHTIRNYNDARDSIWRITSIIGAEKDLVRIRDLLQQLIIMAYRGKAIWSEIFNSYEYKKQMLEISEENNIQKTKTKLAAFEEFAKKVSHLKDFLAGDYSAFVNEYNEPIDEDFANYYKKNRLEDSATKIEFIQNKVLKYTTELDSAWGERAAEMNLSIPLSIREEQDMFFRHYKKATNSLYKY